MYCIYVCCCVSRFCYITLCDFCEINSVLFCRIAIIPEPVKNVINLIQISIVQGFLKVLIPPTKIVTNVQLVI